MDGNCGKWAKVKRKNAISGKWAKMRKGWR
jgi:hypothetical protein